MKGLRKKKYGDKWIIVNRKGERMGLDGDFGPWDKNTIKDNMEFATDAGWTLETEAEWAEYQKSKLK